MRVAAVLRRLLPVKHAVVANDGRDPEAVPCEDSGAPAALRPAMSGRGPPAAERLIAWSRDGSLRPILHGTFRLSDLHRAERYFADRSPDFVGKIAILPDSEWPRHGERFALPRTA